MKIIVMLFFFLFSINLIAQDSTYYKYLDTRKKAEAFVEKGQLKNALSSFDEAFKLIDCITPHYFDAFSVAIDDSNYFKAKEYLIKGALKGFDLSVWNSPKIMLFNTSLYAKEYWRIKDSLLKIHFNSIDLEYYNALQEMKGKDQSKRDGSKEMRLNDSLNFEKLIVLSTDRGFPTFKMTGYGQNIAWLILWHHRGGEEYPNSKQWQRIIPLIKREIYNGMIEPDFFKMFDDFIIQNTIVR